MAIAELGRRVGLDLPKILPGFRIHGGECAAVLAEEYYASSCGKDSTPTVRRSDLRDFPDSFSRLDIDGA